VLAEFLSFPLGNTTSDFNRTDISYWETRKCFPTTRNAYDSRRAAFSATAEPRLRSRYIKDYNQFKKQPSSIKQSI